MLTGLFWVTVGVALLEWLAAWSHWKRIRWVTKPATLVLLIAWFTQIGHWQGPLLWFGIGLVFSLAGDILLMLPDRFFLPGLVAFLMTHLFYIVGYWQRPVQLTWVAAPLVLLVGLVFWLLTRQIRAGLRQRHETGMIPPVMVYATILSLMWLSALFNLLRPGWQATPAILASIGAGLFFLSDAMLAFNRFVRSLPAADLLVMATYHTGQILIALSVLMNFAG